MFPSTALWSWTKGLLDLPQECDEVVTRRRVTANAKRLSGTMRKARRRK